MDEKELPEWYHMAKSFFCEINCYSSSVYEDLGGHAILNQIRFAAESEAAQQEEGTENYSERNLQIIQEAMQELGVSDCEEIPAAIRLLKQRAQQKMHPTLGESPASDSESKPAPKRVI